MATLEAVLGKPSGFEITNLSRTLVLVDDQNRGVCVVAKVGCAGVGSNNQSAITAFFKNNAVVAGEADFHSGARHDRSAECWMPDDVHSFEKWRQALNDLVVVPDLAVIFQGSCRLESWKEDAGIFGTSFVDRCQVGGLHEAPLQYPPAKVVEVVILIGDVPVRNPRSLRQRCESVADLLDVGRFDTVVGCGSDFFEKISQRFVAADQRLAGGVNKKRLVDFQSTEIDLDPLRVEVSDKWQHMPQKMSELPAKWPEATLLLNPRHRHSRR